MTAPTTPTTTTLTDPAGVYFRCPDGYDSSPNHYGAITVTAEDPYGTGAFLTVLAGERMDDTDEGDTAQVSLTVEQAAHLAEFLFDALVKAMA